MIPILETDRAELQKLQDQVGKVYTAKDLEQARQFSIQQKQLGQQWQDLWNTLASDVVPALNATIQATRADMYAHTELRKEFEAGKISAEEYNNPNEKVLDTLRAQFIAADNAKAKIDNLAQSQRDAAAAALEEAKAEDALYDSIHKSLDASFAFQQAQIDLKNAQDAVAASGGNTAENQLRLREAYVKLADAAVALAEQQAQVDGTTLSASQKADIFRGKLQELEAGLDPNSPLRKDLQGYIDELNSIPGGKEHGNHLVDRGARGRQRPRVPVLRRRRRRARPGRRPTAGHRPRRRGRAEQGPAEGARDGWRRHPHPHPHRPRRIHRRAIR